jgi:hypothetical protein
MAPIVLSTSCKSGRGIISAGYFQRGDIIETCAGIRATSFPTNELADYVFSDGRGGYICATGLCAMYNHDDDPNATWHVTGIPSDPMSWTVTVTAIRPIRPLDEIFISYGDAYWTARPHLRKQ